MINSLQHAINGRFTIRVFYDGGYRILEPYCLGYSKAGHLLLSAFQTEGYSRSGKPTAWKLLTVNKIGSLVTLPSRFGYIRHEYNPNWNLFQRVVARV
jgi:hypothetical protein